MVENVTSERERAAMHAANEEATVQLGRAGPELPAVELKKARIGESRDIHLPCQQRRDLSAQPPGRIPVVIVPLDDTSAACQLAGAIALGTDAESLRRMHIANARVAP